MVGNLCHDLWASLNEELIYWEGPELFHRDPAQYGYEETDLVDRLARLLQQPGEHLDELAALRSQHPLLQNVRGSAPDL